MGNARHERGTKPSTVPHREVGHCRPSNRPLSSTETRILAVLWWVAITHAVWVPHDCMHRLLHNKGGRHSPSAQYQSRNEQYPGDLVLCASGHHSYNMVPFTRHSPRLPCASSHWAFPLAYMPGILLRLYGAKRMQAWMISLLITRFQRLTVLHDSNLLLCGWARTCFIEESAWQNPLCGLQRQKDLTSFAEKEIP